jgi:hypothetical protein
MSRKNVLRHNLSQRAASATVSRRPVDVVLSGSTKANPLLVMVGWIEAVGFAGISFSIAGTFSTTIT